LLNDQPLSGLSEATLRQAMSVVPQRVHLFSATLRDNLLLAAPEADDALCAPLRRWAWKNCWKMAD
jgi:ATP-binding cassette subfamily C protein CydC